MNCKPNGKWRGALLSLGGFDPLCSAGVCADVYTFRHFGFKPFAVPTCLTSQDGFGVHLVDPVDVQYLADATSRIFDTANICGVKIGLLPSVEVANALASMLESFEGTVLLDPIIRASGGQMLNQTIPDKLLECVDVITPNKYELEILSANNEGNILQMAESLFDRYVRLKTIVVTGVVAEDDKVYDYLFERNGNGSQILVPYLRKKELHGTGCHYSSALLSGIVGGNSLSLACMLAMEFVASLDSKQRFELPFAPMDLL